MKFVSLASGSSGNASFVCTDKTKILIDCGISARKTDTLLKSIGVPEGLKSIDAVLLTHEHSDHIKGAKRISSAYGIPIYGSSGTLDSLADAAKDEYFNYAGRELMEAVRADFEFEIGDISVTPFRIYHDAKEPCGYRIEVHDGDKNAAVAVMTDCGHYDDYICDHLTELDAMLLEANHDPAMLAAGPYPMVLKRRIMSDRGHLSNEAAGELLAKVFAPRLRSVALGHISKENNTHELAERTVRETLVRLRGAEALSVLSLKTAAQDKLTELSVNS